MQRVILLFLAAVFTAPLTAQTSRSADAAATVTIPTTLTLVNVRGLDFGSHFATEGSVAATTGADWTGTTETGNRLSFTFTALPTSLHRAGGDGADGPVVITYGTSSARITSAVPNINFSPATGLPSYTATSSTFELDLGAGSNPSDKVRVDLGGHSPGTYSGTITLTVTVL
jgi:hypothetical protein